MGAHANDFWCSILHENEKFWSIIYENHLLQLFSASASLDVNSFRTESPLFKLEKAILSPKTGFLTFILPRVHSSILIIVFPLFKSNFESMRSNLYKICLDRNAIVAKQWFTKKVRLYDLLSARSRCHVVPPDVPSQTVFQPLRLLAPKYPCLVSCCRSSHYQDSTLCRRIEMRL